MNNSIVTFILFIMILFSCNENSNNKNTKQILSSLKADLDKEFMMKVGYANTAEVEFGKGAIMKSTKKEIKAFGKLMVTEHSEAQDELVKLARSRGVEIPDTLDTKHKKDKDRISNLTSSDFDKEYVNLQIEDHQKALQVFNYEIKNGKDKDLIRYATKYLPHIEMHLEKAKKLQEVISKK